MKIGIYGSAAGEMNEVSKSKSAIIGKLIAENKGIVVTGACNGIPQKAVIAAHKNGGNCIGFSPAINLEMHKESGYPIEGFTKLIFIPEDYEYKNKPLICKKYRNVSSVAYVDTAIFISGRIGSMNEFTNAYDMGKTIGILEGTGGITKRAIQILIEDANKKTEAQVIFETHPEKLIQKIINTLK